MAVRNARKCRRNCPDQPAEVQVESLITPMVHAITSESEGNRLWKHVLFGTETCINMIEGYHTSNMPGQPLETIKRFSNRLNKIIKAIETKNEGPPSPQ